MKVRLNNYYYPNFKGGLYSFDAESLSQNVQKTIGTFLNLSRDSKAGIKASNLFLAVTGKDNDILCKTLKMEGARFSYLGAISDAQIKANGIFTLAKRFSREFFKQ